MPKDLLRDDVRRLVQEEGAQLLEVLPAEEYDAEHLPGAINVPLKRLDSASTSGLKKDVPVIAYCWDVP